MERARTTEPRPRRGLRILAIVAIVFGLLTLVSGGAVVLDVGEARPAAGAYVPFVVWFNTLAGFAYVAAGIGLWAERLWAAWLAVFLAATTLAVFAGFALYIAAGGAHEPRTVGAMGLRSLVWVVIAALAWRPLMGADAAGRVA